ncbi:MAG: glycosyltransferase family 2 protein [Dehalococcoidia bacterium]|nr:glycosyltransferase family 2 protein [Dehalococcoidia bacterium]
MKYPSVSVIICAYTEERLKDIHEAVDSVLAQTLKPHQLILAIDRNEDLFHRLRIELPSEICVVLNTGTPGLSNTRNTGIQSSTGEIVAFLDDDAVAEESWLENLAPAFDDPRVVAVGGQAVAAWPDGSPPLWFPMEFDFVVGCTEHKGLMMRPDGAIRNVTGSNMAFRREVFEKAGLWETRLGRCELKRKRFNPSGGEEAEMCLRIKSRIPEGRIIFRPEAVVHHKVVHNRARLRYMLDFCLREGHTRALMKGVVSQYNTEPLAAEGVFLRKLVFGSMVQRLIYFYRPTSLPQAAAIVMNLSLMATGYAFGRWIYGQ